MRRGNNYSGARWAHSPRLRAPRDERLVPIVKTRMAPRLTRSGTTPNLECWAAKTADGVWGFEREDGTSSPWLVHHLPSVVDGSYTTPVLFCHTLRDCRIGVGSQQAAKTLAMLKCSHPEDEREWLVKPCSNLFREICVRCRARRVWHVDMDCRSCETEVGHNWFTEV